MIIKLFMEFFRDPFWREKLSTYCNFEVGGVEKRPVVKPSFTRENGRSEIHQIYMSQQRDGPHPIFQMRRRERQTYRAQGGNSIDKKYPAKKLK